MTTAAGFGEAAPVDARTADGLTAAPDVVAGADFGDVADTGSGDEDGRGVPVGELQAATASMMAATVAGTASWEGRMSDKLESARPADGERKVNVRLPKRVTLRRRVTAAILLVTAAAVLVFAAPLAYAVRQLYRNEELTSLQRDAVRIAAVVPDAAADAARALPQRPLGMPADVSFGVYDASGRRLAGIGPERSSLAALAADGRTHGAIANGFSASAPVPSDGEVSATVLTTSAGTAVAMRTWRAWAVMALLALLALVAASVVARLQARRLARPLEELTAAARRLGNGDFNVETRRWDILEADEAATALARTAARLAQVRERERSFARDVSHPLRTPLAGLLLGLENAIERDGSADRSALHRALERGRDVQAIIDDLLELTRPGSPNTSLLGQVLRDTQDRWHGAAADRGRRLVVRPPDQVTRIAAPAPALRQILDVLLDNALLHGSGTITVQAEEIADGVSVTVKDEGPSMRARAASDAIGGLGLPLAESLATSAGAVLHIPAPGGQPIFRLLIPAADDPQTAESYR